MEVDNLFLIVLMLIASAFFSGMEIAFVASNKLKIELNKKQNTFVSKLISVFTMNPAMYISTMLVGNNISLVVYGICMTTFLNPFIKLYIESTLGILLINTVVSTFVILFTAEFLPKTLFRLRPNIVLKIFSVPAFVFYILFYPVTKFTIWFSKLFINKVLKKDFATFENSRVFGKIDLSNLIEEHSDESESEEDNEIRLFKNALDFSGVKLRECMIPRTEIVAVPINIEIDQLIKRFTETGLSRILVYDDNIDNIIAYVHSAVMFKKPNRLSECLSKLIIVPETMSAHKLMKLFTFKHKSIALVVDEFGGTSGVVTIEDIMEEIFGEIEDEHDSVMYVEERVSENKFRFSGRLEIDYINNKYKIGIEESEDYETLAGWILYNNQDIPNVNQNILIDNYKIQIIKVSNTRVEIVEIEILEQ